MLPATRAKTARQKAQREFAAELLLPLADLLPRAGTELDEDAMEAAAEEFFVSPLLV